MPHQRGLWMSLLTVFIGLLLGPRPAWAVGDPPVMTARLHIVDGVIALDPASVRFDLGPWTRAYQKCRIDEAGLKRRIIEEAVALLKARGKAAEQLALGPRPEDPALAAEWDATRDALRAHARTDESTRKMYALTTDWKKAEELLASWVAHAARLQPKPVYGTSGNVHSRLLVAAIDDPGWKGGVAAPPASLKERLRPGSPLASSGHVELQPVPPLRSDKPGPKLRLESNVAEWESDQDKLQAHLVRPFDCELAPQERMLRRAQDYFEIRGVTLEPYRAGAGTAMAEHPFHTGIEVTEPQFRDAGFGGRVILSPDPAIDAIYVYADPRTQGPLIRRVLYLLLPTRDWDRVDDPAAGYLCRADNFPQPGNTAVYLDFLAAKGRELEFANTFLTRAAVAERLRRLTDVGYRAVLDFASKQRAARRKGASLVVAPGEEAPAPLAAAELPMRACEHRQRAPDSPPSELAETAATPGAKAAEEQPSLRVKEPRHHLRLGVESEGGRKPKLTVSFARGALSDQDTFSVSASQQGRPSGNLEYTRDFAGFDHGAPRRVQLSARAFSEYDPDRPTSTAPEDLRRSGIELRLTTDLWRDRAGSFGQADFALTQHDTWEEGAAGPKDRLQKATVGLTFARTRHGTVASPHAEGGVSVTHGRSSLAGTSFRKAEADVAFHRFVGAFHGWDLRARATGVSRTAPQSEWPVFGGEASVRGYAADLSTARRTWVIQNEWWLPVAGLLRQDSEFATLLRRSVWVAALLDVGGMRGAPMLADGRRIGAGVGLRFAQGSDLTMRLDWARPVREHDPRIDRSGKWSLSVSTRRTL